VQPTSETYALHTVVYFFVTKIVFPQTIALGVQSLGGDRFIEIAFVRAFLFLFSILDL
jgi:hypothetical protein